MALEKRTITIHPSLVATARNRNRNLSAAIARMLVRYTTALREARRDLSKQLTPQECALILDALNGSALVDQVSIRLIPYSVRDAIEIDGLDRKWDVDGQRLVEKLDALSPFERLALADAVEAWWERTSRGETPQPVEMLTNHPDDDVLKSGLMVG